MLKNMEFRESWINFLYRTATGTRKTRTLLTPIGVFEIDHPSAASKKAQGLERFGARDNLHLIASDLAQQKLVDVLSANQYWDLSASAVIVAEGLLKYLTDDAVKTLFRHSALLVNNGKIVFTYIPSHSNGRPDAGPFGRLVLMLLRFSGEPWLWSIRPEDFDNFLAELGWAHVPEQVTSTDKHGLEYYAVATRQT